MSLFFNNLDWKYILGGLGAPHVKNDYIFVISDFKNSDNESYVMIFNNWDWKYIVGGLGGPSRKK